MEPADYRRASAAPQVSDERADMRERFLSQIIEKAAHLLPAQGPLGVFVHHNTLHAFEHLPFHDAVQHAARLYDCEPYLSRERYHDEYARGRIRDHDVVRVLRDDLGEATDGVILAPTTRFDLRLAMLRFPIPAAPSVELRWFAANTEAFRRCRHDAPDEARRQLIGDTRHWVEATLAASVHRSAASQAPRRGKHEKRTGRGVLSNIRAVTALLDRFRQEYGFLERWTETVWETFAVRVLWETSRAGVRLGKFREASPPARVRHRDLLLAATAEDSDALVHPLLIRYCAAFIDQGFAHTPLPYRELGFFHAFCRLYGQKGGASEAWRRGLRAELRRLDTGHVTPVQSLLESLDLLGVPRGEWDGFIASTLLAMRGWAGMIHQLEVRSDRATLPVAAGSLLEFLAVRLLLERFALTYIARRTLDFHEPLSRLRRAARAACGFPTVRTADERAFSVFQVAQLLGWSAAKLSRLSSHEWTALEREIAEFSELEQRRIFHVAYERRLRIQVLDALTAQGHNADVFPPPQYPSRRFQAIFCIDEREESIRRHLEEVVPQVETFGVAGFFGVAMYYRGSSDAHAVPLCPVVLRPQHLVEETVVEAEREAYRRSMEARRALGRATHGLHVSSRMGLRGAVMAVTLGVFAALPLVARVLFPWLTSRLRRMASRMILSQHTRLRLERASNPDCSSDDAPLRHGFTIDEMVDIVDRVLHDIGLTRQFARLVLVIGHGSSSLNNPHESAHDCGACGGGRGGPNARAFAQMANDPRVRAKLKHAGLPIPAETVFVGAFHNSCDDAFELFDQDLIPGTHVEEVDAACLALAEACQRNAHERCRRFESAPLDLSPEAAQRHVEARAEDLAQTRPEYGHATNAVCVIGRRARTYGLFLDRRAFLVSYDPMQDDATGTILARTLQAVGPVCAGINLEYYFSRVDPNGYGCGTKLPHNITSLLGVMDGHASDLRTGLPWQMVEIHEPVRLLMIVESQPEVLQGILQRNEALRHLCSHEWIQLATLDPQSDAICVYGHNGFVRYEPESRHLPVVAASIDWYSRRREHLGFARIARTTWTELYPTSNGYV